MADVDVQESGSAEGAQLPPLDVSTPGAQRKLPFEKPEQPPAQSSAEQAFVKPPPAPGPKGYMYSHPGKGVVYSPRLLTEEEVEEVFSQPLSADPQAQTKALDLNNRVAQAARKQRDLFQAVRKSTTTPGWREASASVASTELKMGGALVGAAVGHPFIGAAAGDIAGQGLERATGLRGGFSGRELVAETALGGLAPGVEGSIAGGVAKGAAFGFGSTTLDSLITQGKLPSVGRLAIGTATGALFTGTARKFLRSPLYEISTADVAKETHAILSGDSELSKEFLTPAIKDETAELRQTINKLPGISKNFGKDWSIPQPAMYRGTKGFFRGYSTLRAQNPHLALTEAPFEQHELEFTRPTEGQTPRGSRSEMFQGWLGGTKGYFGRVEGELGKTAPVFTEMYEPIYNRQTQAIEFNKSRMSEVRQATQGLKRGSIDKYQAWLEMSDKNQAARVLRFERGDESRAYELQRTWDRTFKAYGLEDGLAPGGMSRSDEYLTVFKPKLREARHELMSRGNPEPSPQEVINQAFPTAVPKSVQFFRDAMERESIGIADTNPIATLGKHLKNGSYNTWVADYVKDAERRFASNPNMPSGLRDSVTHFLGQVRGMSDPTGRDFAIFMSKVAKGVGVNISSREARAMMDTYIMAQYGSTLGFRPGPLLRNHLQTWQTGFSELGGRWYFHGLKMSHTKEGEILAAQLGLHAGDTGLVQEVMQGAGEKDLSQAGMFRRAMQKVREGAGNITEAGLKRYSNTDVKNRNIMGLGQYGRAMYAMEKAKGNAQKFIDYAWLDSGIFQPGERQMLVDLAKQGRFMEAAQKSAVALADNTQWVYRAEARAPITTGTAGRATMSFFNWGSFYANYLRRLFSPYEFKLNPARQGLRIARFLGANALLAGAGTALGSDAGIEDSWKRVLGWTLVSPAIPSGEPPIRHQLSTGIDALNELAQGDVGTGKRQREFAWAMTSTIPGFGALKDFIHVMDPDQGQEEAILRTSGILPRKAP